MHLDLGGVDKLGGWEQFDLGMVCLMTVGQVLFVATWALLPWWKEWVGRALMMKASTLGLLLLMTITNTMFMLRGIRYPGIDVVTAFGYVLVTMGVWAQPLALAHEIRRGNLAEILRARGESQEPLTRDLRPLLWIGGSTLAAGSVWLVLGNWDVLALLVAGIGVAMLCVRAAVTREPAAVEDVPSEETEGRP